MRVAKVVYLIAFFLVGVEVMDNLITGFSFDRLINDSRYWIDILFLAIPIIFYPLGKSFLDDFKEMLSFENRYSALQSDYKFLILLLIFGSIGEAGIGIINFALTFDLFPELARSLVLGTLDIPLSFIVLWGPIIEEILFRGYFFESIRKRRGAVLGALFSSAVFALLHPAYPVSSFLGGMVLSGLYFKYRSILVPIAFHGFYNAFVMATSSERPLSELSNAEIIESCLTWGALYIAISLPFFFWAYREKKLFRGYFFVDPTISQYLLQLGKGAKKRSPDSI